MKPYKTDTITIVCKHLNALEMMRVRSKIYDIFGQKIMTIAVDTEEDIIC